MVKKIPSSHFVKSKFCKIRTGFLKLKLVINLIRGKKIAQALNIFLLI